MTINGSAHNIHSVAFHFEGRDPLKPDLERISMHRPSKIANALMAHYAFWTPATESMPVKLSVHFNRAPKDNIRFIVRAADAAETAPALVEMTVMLAKETGTRDWRYYMSSKQAGAMDVYTPHRHYDAWRGQENLHNLLADKLGKALRHRGFYHMTDEDDIYVPQRLIGLFLDYSDAQNP